jgi:hypothetical protein
MKPPAASLENCFALRSQSCTRQVIRLSTRALYLLIGLPDPKDKKFFDQLVATGEDVTRLLDAGRDAGDVVETIIGAGRARSLGPLRRIDGKQLRPDDLKLTITYWGGGKGRWKPRPLPQRNSQRQIIVKRGVSGRAIFS